MCSPVGSQSGAPEQAPSSDTVFPDSEADRELLQEADLKIIRQEKCNKIIKKISGSWFNPWVGKGFVCASSELQKAVCKVSPQPLPPLPGLPLGFVITGLGPACPPPAIPSPFERWGLHGRAAGALPGRSDPDPAFQ